MKAVSPDICMLKLFTVARGYYLGIEEHNDIFGGNRSLCSSLPIPAWQGDKM